MLHFDSDYMRGAHPEVMRRLTETNLEQTLGYGTDYYTSQARRLVAEACGVPDAGVWFLTGGTQTNATVIDGLLARHEGVLAAESAHIAVHEAGAIEASGHKVLTLPQHEGKVNAEDVKRFIDDFYGDETYEHMVAPGVLYITYPTEFGTLYSLKELEELSSLCHKYGVRLYLDGARLGYGLAAQKDITLKDIARLCDVFYIGGTKVGALFGEAVVVSNSKLLSHFFPLIKQHGALFAKGRILGIQFQTLFTDNLYIEIARHAVEMAMKLRKGFVGKGVEVYLDSPTNQQFFRLSNEVIDRLKSEVSFELWGARGISSSIVRFVTDWATMEEDVDRLIDIL